MNKMLKTVLSGLVIASMGLISVPSVEAASILLDDGVNPPLQIDDNGLGDLNLTSGYVLFNGSLGVFSFTLIGGRTKPAAGSATEPELVLDVTAQSTATGTLQVWFSEVGFGPTDLTATSSLLGGIGDASSTYQTYQDSSNALFGTTTLLTTPSLTFGPGPFGVSSAVGTLSTGSAPYSLTQLITINHTGPGFTTTTATLSVPDGGWAVGFLGFVLLGVEGLRRRYTQGRF